METKVCPKCGLEKNVSEFSKLKSTKDGLKSWCKICVSAYMKQYHKDHKEELAENNKQYYQDHKEELAENNKQYHKDHKEELAEKHKQYYQDHKEELAEKHKQYYQDHKEELAENNKQYKKDHKEELAENNKQYYKQRYNTDPNYKLNKNIRYRIWYALKNGNGKKNKHTFELVGCGITFLRSYLKAQFKEGMTWENHGEWHVDHIRPCASFDLSNEREQKECFHYTNLQPLWGPDNLSKKDKWDKEQDTMKVLINISGTHGYPEGIIPHMVQTVQAFYYHLNYFYDANILIDMANRQKSRNQPNKKESK